MLTDELYLEAHLSLDKIKERDEASKGDDEPPAAPAPVDAPASESMLTSLTRLYVAATDQRRADVDWDAAERVLEAARGVPALVSLPRAQSFAAGTAAE